MASLMPGGGGVRESLGRILAGSGPMARLARGVLGSGGVWILRLGSTLGLAFLLGHLLGPSEYGVYATVVAHVTLFAPMCCLGYDMLATREFVVARTNGDVEQEVALAHALPRGVWITSAVMLVLFVPASVAWGYFRGKGFEQTILFEALGIALTAHLRLIQGQLRGLGRVSLGQVYQLILPPVLNLVLFVALLAVFPPSAMLAIVTFIAALVIVWPMGAAGGAAQRGAWGNAGQRADAPDMGPCGHRAGDRPVDLRGQRAGAAGGDGGAVEHARGGLARHCPALCPVFVDRAQRDPVAARADPGRDVPQAGHGRVPPCRPAHDLCRLWPLGRGQPGLSGGRALAARGGRARFRAGLSGHADHVSGLSDQHDDRAGADGPDDDRPRARHREGRGRGAGDQSGHLPRSGAPDRPCRGGHRGGAGPVCVEQCPRGDRAPPLWREPRYSRPVRAPPKI
jgi:hypothetical protein